MAMLTIRRVPKWATASIVAACNVLVFGLDTGTIGAVTAMPSFVETFGRFSSTVHGVIVSTILITGAITSMMSGILSDRFGRTRVIGVGSLIFAIGALLETTAVDLPMFIFGRLIKGAGEGLFIMTVYVLIAEISPSEYRGVMTNTAQIFVCSGIPAGFFICYGTNSLQGSLSWRLPLAIQAAIAFGNAVACVWLPQSPRWLIANGMLEDAKKVLQDLGISEEEQQTILEQAGSNLEHSPRLPLWQSIQHTFQGYEEAFSKPVRGRTLFGCYIMAMQQFSGIDGVLYYAPLLFAQAGLSATEASFFASGISSVAMLVVTIPATLFFDKFGRKTLALAGGIGISFFMLLIGSLYAAGRVYTDHGAARWVVIVSIYLYACVFCATWALSQRTYMIESLPRKTRSSGSSLAQSSNWVANYIVALTTPILLAKSSFGAYYFFTACTLTCTIACAFFMVETKGHSLEAIEQNYAARTSTFSMANLSSRLRHTQPPASARIVDVSP